MESLKSSLLVLGSVGLMFLAACSNSNQAANPDKSSTGAKPTSEASPAGTANTNNPSGYHSDGPKKGGQVVETGKYHLEFVPEKEETGTHLDFYVLKDENHEAIPNAKVTGQIQLPDGTQKSLDFKYDAADKHYTAILPGKTPGQYQVKMIADINGEKADARFSFNQ